MIPSARRADYDVIVVGAGPAGAATAARLAARGHRVLLLERSRFDEPRIGESLAPAVAPLLRQLGAWNAFIATCPLPSWGTRSRWGSHEIDVHCHLMQPDQQGWHVDRRAFDEMLAHHAARQGATLRCGRQVLAVEFNGEHWVVATSASDGRRSTHSAAVLVDASGRAGRLARSVGARRQTFDHLIGLGRTWTTAADEGCFVQIEAVDDGWWYSAPLPGDGLITMLMTDADVCRQRSTNDPAVWMAALRAAPLTRERVGTATASSVLCRHAALSGRLRRADARPWLAVGDAALAVDPLTGSGVVRALRGAAAADLAVDELLGCSSDRRHSVVQAYEDDRNEECSDYLQTRLGYYAAGPRLAATFWLRRHRVAERALATAG
jgi:flavin-dependent dehydrogenase